MNSYKVIISNTMTLVYINSICAMLNLLPIHIGMVVGAFN